MNCNLFTNWKSGKAFLAAAMVVCTGFAAHADVLDFGEVEVDKVYTYNQGDKVSATYTAQQDGPVKYVFTGTAVFPYSDADHKNPSPVNFVGYTGHGEVIYTQQMRTGEVAYFFSEYTLGEGSLKVASRPKSMDFLGTSPSVNENSILSASQVYRMTFEFNEPVSVLSASVRLADKSYVQTAFSTYGNSVDVSLFEALMDFYHQGKLNEGDEVTVRLVGVCCADFKDIYCNGNGVVNVKFKVAAKPAELVKTYNAPNTGMPAMLSYYLPGDENAVLTLEFDRDLDANRRPMAEVIYGRSDDIENPPYRETITGSVEGNKLHIDLAGRRRRPVDMLPNVAAGTNENVVTVGVSNMYTPDGQRIYTGSIVTSSAYYFNYPLEVVQYTMASDYVPARGSHIAASTPIELWIMNGSKIVFDGVKLSYKKDGAPASVVLDSSQYVAEPDPESDTDLLINFKVPADFDADENSPIEVTLAGLKSADGLDHASDMKGEYVYATSGVDSIAIDASTTGDVYNMMGIKVLTGATMRDVRALPAGLYIFNGHKVAVK